MCGPSLNHHPHPLLILLKTLELLLRVPILFLLINHQVGADPLSQSTELMPAARHVTRFRTYQKVL